jgi:voltage-gated potassium channel
VPDSDAFYWALSTMTTVGYGDVTPDTRTGQVIAVEVMLVGIGFVAILTGAIAQRFIAPSEQRIDSDERDLHAKVDELGAQL